MPPEVISALDAAAAAQPDTPNRSELIRRIVTEWLQAGAAGPDRTPGRDAAITAKGAEARSHAASTADEEMVAFDATGDEKVERRRALTEEPSIIADARAQAARRRGR